MVKGRKAFEEANLHEALVQEIQWLRRGDGLTLRKLRSTPALLYVVSGGTSIDGRSEQAVFETEQLLRKELANLGDSFDAKALRAALAVDRGADPRTLTQRRCDFAEDTGKHPDTVEMHENRAVHELALRILARRSSVPPLAPVDPTLTAVPLAAATVGMRLIRSNNELMRGLLGVVADAEHYIAAAGSRSRDPEYLDAIEQAVSSSTVVHYRVLCGPPHWSILRSHLVNLLEIKSRGFPSGNARIFIGLVTDFRREPERFICANEGRAVVVLPSLNGMERYDTALELEGPEYGIAYTRLIQEMYAASHPIETVEEAMALPLMRE